MAMDSELHALRRRAAGPMLKDAAMRQLKGALKRLKGGALQAAVSQWARRAADRGRKGLAPAVVQMMLTSGHHILTQILNAVHRWRCSMLLSRSAHSEQAALRHASGLLSHLGKQTKEHAATRIRFLLTERWATGTVASSRC